MGREKGKQHFVCQCHDLYSAFDKQTLASNAVGVLVPCKRKMSHRRLKAALMEFGLQTGSGRLFQADGPKAKARCRPYVLTR